MVEGDYGRLSWCMNQDRGSKGKGAGSERWLTRRCSLSGPLIRLIIIIIIIIIIISSMLIRSGHCRFVLSPHSLTGALIHSAEQTFEFIGCLHGTPACKCPLIVPVLITERVCQSSASRCDHVIAPLICMSRLRRVNLSRQCLERGKLLGCLLKWFIRVLHYAEYHNLKWKL